MQYAASEFNLFHSFDRQFPLLVICNCVACSGLPPKTWAASYDAAPFGCFKLRLSAFNKPKVLFLLGLTHKEGNIAVNACAKRVAAELSLMVVVPNTNPAEAKVLNDPEWDYHLGLSVGLYVNAGWEPERSTTSGHRALTIALKNAGPFE